MNKNQIEPGRGGSDSVRENTDDAVLKRLFDAADNHAEDTGEDHNVGDLQALLILAWELMTTEQRFGFLKSDVVRENIEAGARDQFTAEDLVKLL